MSDLEPLPGDIIVVWFSCGAASAIAARETIRRYGEICDVRLVNNPVIEEDADNLRFLRDVERWLGYPVEKCINPAYPSASAVDVWDARKGMSFKHGAPCTWHLKKEARQFYESKNRVDWNVLGFTSDEVARYERFSLMERGNVLPVLIDAGINKEDCWKILMAHGVEPPASYFYGFPTANCKGCVKASSPTYWNLVRKVYPSVFEDRALQSRRLGARLVRYRGERLYLDELPPNAIGRPLKSMKIDCGIFCEEDDLSARAALPVDIEWLVAA